jgi:sugar transferase (PEP-CTERM/EpsH1 system associated)
MFGKTPHVEPPLVAHVIHKFAVGGLENGLVNLINHMPQGRYRHAIVCLTGYSEFRDRLIDKKLPVISLNKTPGQDFGVHLRFQRVLRLLKPDIVHTRNLSSLELQITAALAGIRHRIHGEHGRDVFDLEGQNFKYKTFRKAMRPIVHEYTAVSKDLVKWLTTSIGIKSERVTQIYNGVDIQKFRPSENGHRSHAPAGFTTSNSFVIGTVGRMETVKDQITLVQAFIHLLNSDAEARRRFRLILIGDGSLRQVALDLLRRANVEDLAWLPGEREDVAEMMRALDVFVLPSVQEGISNTILEAMATGLPVVATRVGGNPELISENLTGMMVPPSDPIAMADAIRVYFLNPDMRTTHGREGRRKVESCFSMEAMVSRYLNVYDSLLFDKARNARPGGESLMSDL